MKSGISYEQGEIVLTPFPYTNLTYTKKRPVIVISNNNYNATKEDFVVCGITTNIEDKEYGILINQNDLANGYLPEPSCIKVDKIFTLEQKLAIKKLGKVKKHIFEMVKKELEQLTAASY